MFHVYGDEARSVQDKDKLTVSEGPNGIHIFSKDGKEAFRTFLGKDHVKEGDTVYVLTDSVEGHPRAKICNIKEYGIEADKQQVLIIQDAIKQEREKRK